MVFSGYLEEVKEVCCGGMDFDEDCELIVNGRKGSNHRWMKGLDQELRRLSIHWVPVLLGLDTRKPKDLNILCDLDCFHPVRNGGVSTEVEARNGISISHVCGGFRPDHVEPEIPKAESHTL